MSQKLVLHEYSLSGNCYKIRLAAALLGVALERREYDLLKGETRTPEFLATVNANGRVPVLQVGGRFIPESNAATYYVADSSHLVPTDRFDHADMLRWMSWEQYNHEPNIATLRFWMRWLGEANLSEVQRLQMDQKREAGNAALKLMDDHLAGREWFVGDRISIADICLFAYTHVAGEADFPIDAFPNVSQWIERVTREPGFIPMDA
jgi:glutathione S-transferase